MDFASRANYLVTSGATDAYNYQNLQGFPLVCKFGRQMDEHVQGGDVFRQSPAVSLVSISCARQANAQPHIDVD